MSAIPGLNPPDIEILIAEDSSTQAEKLRYLLDSVGYRTRLAGNGRIAFESLKQRPANLVLSDIVMPEMDGYALCRAIKSEPTLARIPVILLTTLADPKDIIAGLDCGADNFIRKPYDDEQLLARVQDVLVNHVLRWREPDRRSSSEGIEIFLAGQRYFINSERRQILDLLISTFEQAVRVNEELKARDQQISELNSLLARHAAKLEGLNQTLAQKNDELEQASQAKLRFFAHMSHELRTPLNAVIGFSDLLLNYSDATLNAEQKNYVQEILHSGNHLLSLINDTLDLAKIEAHKLELQPEETDVRDLLQGALPMVREQAAARRIRLELSIDAALDRAWLDARKVTQIVLNLLSNAVKFTPDGGSVTLNAQLRAALQSMPVAQSSISQSPANASGPWLHIAVCDTGIGIPADDIPKLFRSFEQIDNSVQRHTRGTGLGLALVKQLSELHGGSVSVESEVDRGSCFNVYLPLRYSR